MPAAGSKGAPKNPGELKDDTSSSREEKQVKLFPVSSLSVCVTPVFIETLYSFSFFDELKYY